MTVILHEATEDLGHLDIRMSLHVRLKPRAVTFKHDRASIHSVRISSDRETYVLHRRRRPIIIFVRIESE